MKKAFSFMEVILSTVILSFVMIVMIQIKSDNIFLVEKMNKSKKLSDYISTSIDTNISKVKDRNINLFLSDLYTFENDDIRREFKAAKVKIKDKRIDTKKISADSTSFEVSTYSTSFSISENIKKNIYTFKIEL